jgi:hypothetical protein
MKKFFLVPACLVLLGLAACEVTSSTDPNTPQGDDFTPPYSVFDLSGKIFGQNWKSQVAIIRPSTLDKTKVYLEVYSTAMASPCQTAFTSAPYATVSIPSDYQAKEYAFNWNTGTLLTFSAITDVSKNLIADSSKLKITTVNATGFDGYLYAKGVESNGTVSEINGKMQVIDCRKQVNFAVWDEFARYYDLVEFDGQVVGPFTANGAFNSSSFYSRQLSKYMRSFILPLFYGVGSGTTASYSVGPIEGLGTTTTDEYNGVKTITYRYYGPINYKNADITMYLDMKVVSTFSNVKVQYTLEVPNQISKTTHSFTLRK